MSTAEILKFVVLAFAAGITLPIAIQLFLTLRAMHRTVESTSRRLAETLDSLEAAAKRAQQTQSPGTRTLTAMGAALIPAVVAAVRAYRGEAVTQTDDPDPETENPAEEGKAEDGPAASSKDKETSHARA
jgi:hypothetical protein